MWSVIIKIFTRWRHEHWQCLLWVISISKWIEEKDVDGGLRYAVSYINKQMNRRKDVDGGLRYARYEDLVYVPITQQQRPLLYFFCVQDIKFSATEILYDFHHTLVILALRCRSLRWSLTICLVYDAFYMRPEICNTCTYMKIDIHLVLSCMTTNL